jgi:hypothetical protein
MDGGVLKNRNGFVFGTGGRLSLETYLSDRIVFMLQGESGCYGVQILNGSGHQLELVYVLTFE